MSRIIVLGGEEICDGFALAGVRGVVCTTEAEAVAAIRSAVDDSDIGIVIVEEHLIEGVDPRARRELERRIRPLIVPIPQTLEWKDTEEVAHDEVVARLIRQAVGYQLNMQI